MHAYGVFPAYSPPPIKWSPVIEGSDDGVNWHPFEFHYFQSTEYTKPVFLAPYHPRFDHGIFYEAYGTNDSTFVSSTLGACNPYEFTQASSLDLIMQRLLSGTPGTFNHFRKNRFSPAAPPAFVRAILYRFQPTSLAEKKATGKWWTKTYAAIHTPATGIDVDFEIKRKTQPELFHWDWIYWRRWAPALQQLLKTVQTQPVADALRTLEKDLAADTAAIFWNICLPLLQQKNWDGLTADTKQFQDKIGYEQFIQTEVYWCRLAIALGEKLMPMYLKPEEGEPKFDNYFDFGLFIHHIIIGGKQAWEAVFTEPKRAVNYYDDFITTQAFFSYAFFRSKMLAFVAAKNRLSLSFNQPQQDPKGLPGFIKLIDFTASLFPNAEEQYPELHADPVNGNWTVNGELIK